MPAKTSSSGYTYMKFRIKSYIVHVPIVISTNLQLWSVQKIVFYLILNLTSTNILDDM